MLVPKLRFPGFEDEWQVAKLGDIAHFSKGAGVSKSDIDLSGSREAIRYGELYTIYGEVVGDVHSKIIPSERDVLSEDNDVLIPSSGETAIDISTATYVGKNGVAVGGDLNIIRINESGRFLSYLLNHGKKLDVARLAQGVSVVHLYASELKGLQIEVPAKEEQEKIADFLMAVDERIELQSHKVEKLETYKRGLTQKIFTRTLRFKRDDGSDFPEWKKKKLGDIATVKTGNLNVQDADETAKYIFFDRSEEIKRYREYSFNKEALIYPGEGAKFLPRYFNGKFGLHQRAYAIFDTDGILTKFLYYYLLTKNNHFISTAVGTTVKSLRMNCFESCPVVVPNLDEQQKIATFLSQIDEKITLETEKLKGLKKFKKSLLQRMFV